MVDLAYSLTGIQNFREVCYESEDTLRPVTKALINASAEICLNKITSSNVDEWITRLMVMNIEGIDDRAVADHIGLHTNAKSISNRVFYERYSPVDTAGLGAD